LKGYRPENGADWLPTGGGLRFDGSGVAFTEAFFPVGEGSTAQVAGLTIEMLLHVEEMENAAFRYILSVHGGSDQQQLLIGQWRRWLMVMNGDDYDAKQGLPKIYVDLGAARPRTVWFAVVADGGGTSVFLDGRLVKHHANLHLGYPSGGGRVRLVLGNSVWAKHGWRGAIQGLALYSHALDEKQPRLHYDQWAAGGALALDRAALPEIFYGFEAPVAGRLMNRAADRYHLEVPALMRVLKREYLQWPRFGSDSRRHMLSDGALNLAGFVPLGFVLVVLLGRLGDGAARVRWVAAIGVACLLSVFMEVVQAWIPSRDSSMLDWVLNTVGTGLGGWLGFGRAQR
jgi:VanZ family protein